MQYLRHATAATFHVGPMIDDTDGKTAETALTISQADIRLSKNGGDIAQTNNATGATHDELGLYSVPLDTTDTGTLGRLDCWVYESGALIAWRHFQVIPAVVYDALVLGTDYLQTDVTQISGDATAADNLELMYDGTGYAGGTTKLSVAVASLADDVITAAKFDESTAFPLKSADTGSTAIARTGADSDTLETLSDEIAATSAPSAASIADAVWDEALSGHVTAGSAGKKLGDAPSATQLTAAIATGTVNTAIAGSYEVTVGTTWSASITGLGDMSGRTALYVAVKTAIGDTDDAAIIRWTEGTGLTRLSGSATTASYGTIAVDDATDGDITVTLTIDGTSGLSGDLATGLTLAVKCIKSGEIWEKYGSGFSIVDGWIDATS